MKKQPVKTNEKLTYENESFLDCSVEKEWSSLHKSLRLPLACYFLGTLQQSIVDVFGTGDLRLDHAQVLGVRHGLCLHRVWFGGCWHQVGRMFRAVNALGEALVGQSLHKGFTKSHYPHQHLYYV